MAFDSRTTMTRAQKLQYIFGKFQDPPVEFPTNSDKMKGAFQQVLITKMQDYSLDQTNPILDMVIDTYQANGGT